jgi:hypothetical protein
LLVLNQITVSSAQKYNVAQLDGCEYTASSTFFENLNLPPEAFDGLTHTKWGSRSLECTEEPKDVDEWIQVTFPEQVVIDEVYVSQDIQWSNIGEFKILVLEDEEWKEVYLAQYEDQFSSDTIELDEPVTTTAFRIHVTKVIPFTSSADFFEIEVYGMTLEEANATPSDPTPEPTDSPETQSPAKTSPSGTTTTDSDNTVVYVVWAVCVVIIIAAVIATVLMINKNKNKKS